MTPPEEFDIRYSTLEDLLFLQQCFADPEEREPFPFETDEETGESLKNWIGFSKYKASLTGTMKGEPSAIGTLFLMPYRKVAHHCSFYLVVKKEERRKGIGTSMVRNLLHLAKTRFKLESVHVEFYAPSPLQSILEQLRFELYARQEQFVATRARVMMEHFFS